MKWKIRKGTVLLAIIVLVGCGNSVSQEDLTQTNVMGDLDENQTENKSKTEKYLEDYDSMWATIKDNYPYYNHLPSEVYNGNLSELEEDYRTQIYSVNNDMAFLNKITDCISQLNTYGHLYNWDYPELYFEQMNVCLGEQEDAGEQLIYSIINNPISKKFYQYTDSASEQTSEVVQEESTSITMKYEEDWGASYVKLETLNYIYLQDQIDKLKRFFTKSEEMGFRNCIIDLRGNGGGATDTWVEGIVM